ncbi:MAG TPA: FkbM family methyltransferase [Bacteroidia bacterium]|nr:FkbM family methyltransferase [Bacteroidia bacterium]
MKNFIKTFLQTLLGYDRYLRRFGWYKVKSLYRDAREQDFFFFLTMLKKDDRILDIGANLGFLAVHMAKKVNEGEVIAFEPMPDNLSALRYVKEKSRCSNIRIEACALGDHDGEAEMILPVFGKAKQQGLSHVKHESIHEHNSGITFKVPLKKLDSLDFIFAGKKIAAIKMDVENFEQFVLRGAKKLLNEQHPVIYTELWENENREKCFEITGESGYKPFVHVSGKLEAYDKVKHAGKINFFLLAG